MCVIVNLSRTHLIFRRLELRSYYAHSVVIGQLALELKTTLFEGVISTDV